MGIPKQIVEADIDLFFEKALTIATETSPEPEANARDKAALRAALGVAAGLGLGSGY